MKATKSQKKPTRCRVCSCTEDRACPGGCSWVEPGLCSACVPAHNLNGAQLIAQERVRQMQEEGYTTAHDDRHKKFQLTQAAISYAETLACPDEWAAERGLPPGPTSEWPWAKRYWKPSAEPIRNLQIAGALLAAEMDRLLRLRRPTVKKGGK